MDIKVFIEYGINLTLEEIDRQVSHMQSLIFSECSFVDEDLFQCQPNQEILDIIFSHMPLNEAIEPEVLSTIVLDIAEELALWILEQATQPLDARMAGLFAYDFIYQSLKTLFSVDLYREEEEIPPAREDHDPMFG